ncbi:MAG: bifunctional UDP-3-O-[3-hydroxymyristoyl] N-acetylglucosamine deacetylase/3-hydroxyacyl-ACP dehydratase [Ignavibacteriae bacterium]|nr:MAG: bifunctional UDP-3-O-[3-hydroxymyristoyl] N-acetylglucosamine deacetylase/3-hydroxyacyl-ACP dehydratase [Ignavibacteriota bacterium]
MLTKQRTICKEVSIKGIGLHTGNDSTLTFKPAPENYGIRFKRIDLENSPEILADIDHVIDISRGTTIAVGDAQVKTVEHVLAAIMGCEIDNIIVELTTNEPPVTDGSAKPFVDILLEAGFLEQNAMKDYLVIEQTVHYRDDKNEVDIVALPLDDFKVTVMIDYRNPALGSQYTGLFSLENEFATEFAPSRTFCFLHEVEELHELGLIKGGKFDNAVVIVDRDLTQNDLECLMEKLGISGSVVLGENGILNNNQLRFKNEPARHKLMDLIGDMALIGAPIKGHILAARPGHKANIEFVKLLRKLYQQNKLKMKYHVDPAKAGNVIFDIDAIKKMLPHRYPFLLVDKVVDMELGKRIVGVKNVTVNEPFFQGHFPQKPIMPGVLIVEAMAQTGGLLIFSSTDSSGNGNKNGEPKLAYFTSIDGARFRKPVIPGDQLFLEVEILAKKRNIYKMKCKAYKNRLNGELACEAEIMIAIGV